MSHQLFAFQMAKPLEESLPLQEGFYDADQQVTVWRGDISALANQYYCSGCLNCTQNCSTWTSGGYDYCSQYGPVVWFGSNCNR